MEIKKGNQYICARNFNHSRLDFIEGEIFTSDEDNSLVYFGQQLFKVDGAYGNYTSNFELYTPVNNWDFVEQFYPNYSSCDEILELDILTKICNREQVSNEDWEWAISVYGGCMRKLKQIVLERELIAYKKAATEYLKQK